MPFHEHKGIRYFSFDTLDQSGVMSAVFTRRGGVSPAPWTSLNVGGGVGDAPERVAENRQRALSVIPKTVRRVAEVWQVHSAAVHIDSGSPPMGAEVPRADVLLTDRPDVALFMRFADCVPILLHDPVGGAVGLVHAGWRGTVLRNAQSAVAALVNCFGSRPRDLLAAIGPSIGPDHYEVGPQVIAAVHRTFGEAAPGLLPSQGEAVHFDLWRANQLILEQAGVQKIEIACVCTACHPEDWYSHRGEPAGTGRFGALIVQT